MESVVDCGDENRNAGLPNCGDPHVQVIVQAAHEELRRLIQQRAEIKKRIDTIKQTIVGLSHLFGDDELSHELRDLINRKAGIRRPGLTQACRAVLMEAGCPVDAREVCERIHSRTMPALPLQKNLVAAVTVVLNRLAQYGEAHTVFRDNGRRAWLWVSDACPVNSVEKVVAQR